MGRRLRGPRAGAVARRQLTTQARGAQAAHSRQPVPVLRSRNPACPAAPRGWVPTLDKTWNFGSSVRRSSKKNVSWGTRRRRHMPSPTHVGMIIATGSRVRTAAGRRQRKRGGGLQLGTACRHCGTEMRLMRKVGCQAVPWDVLSGQRGPGAGPRGLCGGECGARGVGGLRAALSAAADCGTAEYDDEPRRVRVAGP